MKRLIRALRREPLDRPPVWLMRQAGRYLPEYRALREKAGGFLAMVQDPETATEITLQPVRRFGMDAAILYSDILLPPQAMGLDLAYGQGGPSFAAPIREDSDVAALREVDPARDLPYVGETLGRVAAELGEGTALLGFCGAPFTLACYMVEGAGSRQWPELRRMIHRHPGRYERLAGRLAEVAGAHLAYQAECGAEALVLFDTWAGSLSRPDYLRYAAPWARRALEIAGDAAPRIVYADTAGHLLDDLADLGVSCVGLDHRTPLGQALDRVGDRVAIQGNLDPAALLSTPGDVAARTRALLDEAGGRPGHILNLGHGVLKWTDPDCVAAFVDAATAASP